MPARRRRTGSENEQPFVIVTDSTSNWSYQSQSYSSPNSWVPNPYNAHVDYKLEPEHISEVIEPEPIMTSRDRTNEFVTAIRSMQGRNIARAVAVRDPRKAKVIQSHSEFMHIAKSIGKNIASTYTKLEKLTLCKYSTRSIWHDFNHIYD